LFSLVIGNDAIKSARRRLHGNTPVILHEFMDGPAFRVPTEE